MHGYTIYDAHTIIDTTITTTTTTNIKILLLLLLLLLLLSSRSLSLQLATAYSDLKLCRPFGTFALLLPIRNVRDFTLLNIDFKRRIALSLDTLRRQILSATILAFSKEGLSSTTI